MIKNELFQVEYVKKERFCVDSDIRQEVYHFIF